MPVLSFEPAEFSAASFSGPPSARHTEPRSGMLHPTSAFFAKNDRAAPASGVLKVVAEAALPFADAVVSAIASSVP